VNIVSVKVVEAAPIANRDSFGFYGPMEIVLVGASGSLLADVDATVLARIIKVLTRR
jgi:hypothetical protein